MASPGAPDREQRYDRTTIWLHWLTAGLVGALWILGQTVDYFPRGAPRVGARSVHIVVGAALLVVLVIRLAWRARWGRGLPLATPGIGGRVAKFAHVMLYLLLASTLLLGVANAWIRGDSLFGLFKIPSIAPGNKALRQQVEDLHGTVANVTVVIALLHAAAALVHRYILHDRVLQRMLSEGDAPPR
jgi:cytochrome b561